MRRLVPVLLVAFACGPLLAHAQTLAYTYKAGGTYKYTFHSSSTDTIDLGAMSIPVTLDLTAQESMSVNSVASNGTADLEISLSGVTLKTSANGVTNTTTGTPAITIDMKVSADGRVVSVSGSMMGGSPFAAFTGASGGYMSAVLPDIAVKPGDTWTKDYDQPSPIGSSSIHVTSKSKYLRDETFHGVNAAVVETNSTATFDLSIDMSKAASGAGSVLPSMPGGALSGISIKGTTTSDTTTWMDPSAHRLLKSHTTGKIDGTMSLQLPASSSITGLTGPFSIKGTDTSDLALV